MSDNEPAPVKRSRISQACEPCRKKRIRCRGNLPCPQCQADESVCVYETARKRGPKAPSGDDGTQTPPVASSAAGGRRSTHGGGTLASHGSGSGSSPSVPSSASPPAPGSNRGSDGPTTNMYRLGGLLGSAEALPRPPMAVPNASFAPQPSIGPNLHIATPAALTRAEIDELADNVGIHVSLDDHGRAQSIFLVGESSGMTTIPRIATRACGGERGGYVGRMYSALDRLAQPRDFPLFLSTWIGCEHRALCGMLVDFYYNELHQIYPFLPRTMLEDVLGRLDAHLDASLAGQSPMNDQGQPVLKPSPPLLHSFFAYAANMFERTQGLTMKHSGGANVPAGVPRFPLSRVMTLRAKQDLMTHLAPNIETIMSCMFLAVSDLVGTQGQPGVMIGMAMRLAIELGLHQSQMFMLHRRGQPNAALPSPSAMTVYSKAWCCCYVLDQQIAYKFGRPASVGAGDVVLSFDFVIDTAENRLRFPGSELDPPDAPWIWHARLVDIFGKISRTINNMYLRRHLAHSLPELHALLLDYQKQLPASLRFDVNDESTQRSVAVSFLHLLYYSAVLSLYRPFLSSRLFHTDSVLRKQHFAIVEKCVTAIPTISLQHMTSPLARLYSPVYMMHVFAGCCSLLECSPTVEQRQRVLSVLHLSARVIEGSVAQAPDYSTVLRLLCFEFAHRVSNDDAFEPFGSPCFKDDPGPKPTSEARTESLERELDIIMDQIVDVELLASEICGAQGVRTDPARERFEVGASARALERELCAYFGRPVPPFSAASATPATAAPTTAPPVAVPATPPMSFESASQASDGQSTRYGVVGSGTGIPPHLHYPFTSPPPPRATAPSMAHYYSDPSTFMQPNRTAPPAASDSFAPLHWDPMQLDPGHLPLFPPALTSHDPNVIAPDFGSVDIGGGEAAEALGGFGRGPPAPAFSFESIVQPGAGLGMGMGLSMPMGMGMGMGMSMGLGMPMSMSMGMGMGAFPLESATPPTHHHPRPPPPVPSSGGDEFMRQLGQLLQ